MKPEGRPGRRGGRDQRRRGGRAPPRPPGAAGTGRGRRRRRRRRPVQPGHLPLAGHRIRFRKAVEGHQPPRGPPASWREPTPKVTRIRTVREKTIARARMDEPSARKCYTGQGEGEGEGGRGKALEGLRLGDAGVTTMRLTHRLDAASRDMPRRHSPSLFVATAFAAWPMTGRTAAQQSSLLSGRVTSTTGVALAGIPVRAHRVNSPVTVAVYSNSRGEYSFPELVGPHAGHARRHHRASRFRTCEEGCRQRDRWNADAPGSHAPTATAVG